MFVQLKPEYGVNYKAGQIFFTWKYLDPIYRGISWFEYRKSNIDTEMELEKVSHVGICTGEGKGIESTLKDGVHYCDLNKYLNDPYCRIVFREPKKLDELGAERLISITSSYIGQKYDLGLNIGIGINYLLPFLSDEVKEKILCYFNSTDKFNCSELVMTCLWIGQYTTDNKLKISPEQLFNHELFKQLRHELNEKNTALREP